MTAPNAYRHAIKDASYVVHVASPVPLKPNNQALSREGKSFAEVYYEPAVKGTLGILTAAADTPSVKRVVVTASGNVLASVVGEAGAGPSSIRRCPGPEEQDAVADPGQAYKMSKILAVTAARDFVREEREKREREGGGSFFDLVFVCPGYVQGGYEICGSVEEFYTTTSAAMLNVALGKNLGVPNVASQVWVDDVARAHVVSLSSADIGDGDVLVLVGNGGKGWPWDEVGPLVGEMFPDEVSAGVLTPVKDQLSMALNFDASETEKKLGWQFKGPEIWAKEVVEQYLALRKG